MASSLGPGVKASARASTKLAVASASEISDISKALFGGDEESGSLRVHHVRRINNLATKVGGKLANDGSVQRAFTQHLLAEATPDEKRAIEILLQQDKESKLAGAGGFRSDDVMLLIRRATAGISDAQKLNATIETVKVEVEEQRQQVHSKQVDDLKTFKINFGKLWEGARRVPKALVSFLSKLIDAVWYSGKEANTVADKGAKTSEDIPLLMSMSVNIASLLLTLALARRFVAATSQSVPHADSMHFYAAARVGGDRSVAEEVESSAVSL